MDGLRDCRHDHLQVFQCPNSLTSEQSLHIEVGPNAFLFSLPDPIVCFKDAIYAQDQASVLLLIRYCRACLYMYIYVHV